MTYYTEFMAKSPADALHHLETQCADLPKEAFDHAKRAIRAMEGSLHGVHVKLSGHMASLSTHDDNVTTATHEIREVVIVPTAPAKTG